MFYLFVVCFDGLVFHVCIFLLLVLDVCVFLLLGFGFSGFCAGFGGLQLLLFSCLGFACGFDLMLSVSCLFSVFAVSSVVSVEFILVLVCVELLPCGLLGWFSLILWLLACLLCVSSDWFYIYLILNCGFALCLLCI